MNIKQLVEEKPLNVLCNSITKDIHELAECDYKTKKIFVLLHILTECLKGLKDVNTKTYASALIEEVESKCNEARGKMSELQAPYNFYKHFFNKNPDILEENNDINNLYTDINKKFENLKDLVKEWNNIRQNSPLAKNLNGNTK